MPCCYRCTWQIKVCKWKIKVIKKNSNSMWDVNSQTFCFIFGGMKHFSFRTRKTSTPASYSWQSLQQGGRPGCLTDFMSLALHLIRNFVRLFFFVFFCFFFFRLICDLLNVDYWWADWLIFGLITVVADTRYGSAEYSQQQSRTGNLDLALVPTCLVCFGWFLDGHYGSKPNLIVVLLQSKASLGGLPK